MSVRAYPLPRRQIDLYQFASEALAPAGVQINGPQPWDIQVHHPQTINRFLANGRLGVGEAYMDGWWDCDRLDEFVARVLRTGAMSHVSKQGLALAWLRASIMNLQSRSRSFAVGERHYDLGNELFEAMLDSRMVYTCGYWAKARTLEEAQEHKLDLVCRKIGLQRGMRVLDIGCGWGSFARFAAERYGVEVLGVTVAREQADRGAELCAGLPVELRLQDYRDVDGEFDRVVSLGMFEHVGYKNYRRYMQCVRRVLKPEGMFLLHTIGSSRTKRTFDPWLEKYIFPNGMLPSIAQIGGAIEGLFVMEDWHNFGADYDKTLMAWWRNFSDAWPRLRSRYGDRFFRMWRFYLLSCAGSFRARHNQLWQVVMAPSGVAGGYAGLR
ncbi:MAG: cyclopropane fatty acyl phospholipid synthase [Candidatus Hydrogenedentes bacterium]|nr:cyclopropane fatty acyl phospholipid synthase [Candidatus Hydrogenedentota bacterium]